MKCFYSMFKKIIFAKIIITSDQLTNKYIRLFSKSFQEDTNI